MDAKNQKEQARELMGPGYLEATERGPHIPGVD